MSQITLAEVYPHPQHKVFAAFATADALAQWIAPSDDMPTHVEIFDFKPERHFRIGFTVDDSAFYLTGQFLTIRPHHAISFTWMWEPPAPHAGIDSHVSVMLTQQDDGTKLTLTHSRLDAEGMSERHSTGWTISLTRLRRLLKENT